jgi:hypothetical protein
MVHVGLSDRVRRHRPAVAGLAVAGLATAAALLSTALPATAATGSKVTGGNSTIDVSKAQRAALHGAGVTLSATGKASYKKHTIKLPVSGGTANPPNYGLRYAGGIKFTKGHATVKVTKLKIAQKSSDVTGVVNGKKRINIFVDGTPQGGKGGPGDVTYGGYTVKFAGAAKKVFDKDLNTKTFTKHAAVGTGTTTVKYKA